MATVQSSDMCTEFKPNNWKPELCVNCQKHESDHRTVDGKMIQSTITRNKEGNNFKLRVAPPNNKIIRPADPPPSPSQAAVVRAKSKSLPVTSRLPTRAVTRAITSKPATDNITSIQENKKAGESNIVHIQTPKSGVPIGSVDKPVRLVTPVSYHKPKTAVKPTVRGVAGRSESLRLPKKPAITARKPVLRAGSQRVKENQARLSVYQNTEVNAAAKPSEKTTSMAETTAANTKCDGEEFHMQLEQLELRPEHLHQEDYKALKTAWGFSGYKDYNEHVHDSPFHKLAKNIKHHQDRHRHHSLSHDDHPSNKSYMSTECHYGSVDVTNYTTSSVSSNLQNGQYDNAIPRHQSKVCQQVFTSPKYEQPIPSQDAIQPGAPCSPKYDPVALMARSHESEQSERIYAEVEDLFLGVEVSLEPKDPDIQTNPAASEYEIMSETPLKVELRQTRNGSMTQSLVNSGQSNKQSSTISFLKTLLKKGGKRDSLTEGQSSGTVATLKAELPTIISNGSRQKSQPQSRSRQQSSTSINNLRNELDTVTSSKVKKVKSPNGTMRPENKPPPPPSAERKPSEKDSESAANTEEGMASESPESSNTDQEIERPAQDQPEASGTGEGVIPVDRANHRLSGYDVYDEPWESAESLIASLITKSSRPTSMADSKTISLSSVAELNPLKQNIERQSMASGKPYTNGTDEVFHSGDSNSSYTTVNDSILKCFERQNSIIKATLGGIASEYQRPQSSSQLQVLNRNAEVSWDDIELVDAKPLHLNNKAVFYRCRWKHNDEQQFIVMLSLRSPVAVQPSSIYALTVSKVHKTHVDPQLIPEVMIISANNSPKDRTKSQRASESKPDQTDGIVDNGGSRRESFGSAAYDKPWDGLQESAREALEASYHAGLLRRDKAAELLAKDINVFLTIHPNFCKIQNLQSYLKEKEHDSDTFTTNVVFCLLQVICLVFTMAETNLQPDILSLSDLLAIHEHANGDDYIPTVTTHTINLKTFTPSRECHGDRKDYSLLCEKLRMFVIQLVHSHGQLSRSASFMRIEEMIQSAKDEGDLRTISLVLQYLLWGPCQTTGEKLLASENKKLSFDHWLNLERCKLVNEIAVRVDHKLFISLKAQFLCSLTGVELFKVTKLLLSSSK